MFNPTSSNTKDSKNVLGAALLNTQHYKVHFKGKVEYRLPLHLGVIAIEKGALGSPSIKFANYTFY